MPSGMPFRDGHPFIFKISRSEMILVLPLPLLLLLACILASGRTFKLVQLSMTSCLSVLGSTSGKQTRDGQFCTSNLSRKCELLPYRPSGSSFRPSQPSSTRILNMGSKPVSGNDTSLGQWQILSSLRDLRLCNLFGSSSMLGQSLISKHSSCKGSHSPMLASSGILATVNLVSAVNESR